MFFGLILGIYSVCTNPGFSWSCMDNDCFNFAYAARYGTTETYPGYPLYCMLAVLVSRIPLGSEAWRLGWFLSTIPAVIDCILIFLIVEKQTINRWSPWVASAALAGSNIFLAQSIVIKVYPFCIMFILATYLAYLSKKEKTLAVWAGLTACTHPLLLPAAGMMGITGVRKRWWWIPVAIVIPLFLYCIIRTPSFIPFFPTSFSKVVSDCGNLPLESLPERLRDTGILLCCGLGLSLIPAFAYLKDFRRSWLLWGSMVLPFTYWIFNMTEITYVHFLFCFPFLAIAAGLGLDEVKIKPLLIFSVSIILLLLMPFCYDIGNNMDKSLSAQKFYEELQQLPDKTVISDVFLYENDKIGLDGKINNLVYWMNKKDGRNLFFLDSLLYYRNAGYRKVFEDQGWTTPEDLKWTAVVAPYEAPLYVICVLAKANPDVKFYYMRIPEDECMTRILNLLNPEDAVFMMENDK